MRPASAVEDMAEQIAVTAANGERITVLVGPQALDGTGADLRGLISVADRYTLGRPEGGDLAQALMLAAGSAGDPSPYGRWAAYRRVFRDWLSAVEVDAIVQQAVISMYRPADPPASPLAVHGLWQRIDRSLGERLENDLYSWSVPHGLQALGAVLARRGDVFGGQVVTTNADPLIEIAVRVANGRAVSASAAVGSDISDAAVRVLHMSGFWRPLGPSADRPYADPGFGRGLEELLTGETICVVGQPDPDGSLRAVLERLHARRPIRVLWADAEDSPYRSGRQPPYRSHRYQGVTADALFPVVAGRFGVPWRRQSSASGLRHRQYGWERQLLSVVDDRVPDDVPGLLRQVERKFGWRVASPEPAAGPGLVFWPIRLRTRASLINMVQAFMAGALAKRGVRIVVSFDDIGVPGAVADAAADFRRDIDRWMAATGAPRPADYARLSDLDEDDRGGPEALLRPVQPWQVAKEVYGGRNSSLYSILAAVKAVPNIPLHAIEDEAQRIVQALLSSDAHRLLTPLTVWAHLHRILLSEPSSDVLTLGGNDEQLFWQHWEETFGYVAAHLYNPFVSSARHTSGALQWSSAAEAFDIVDRARRLPGWDMESALIPWLAHNALLLPAYLTGETITIAGRPIDSWATLSAAADDDPSIWDTMVERISALYLP